jgi:hypothetical protein
MRVSSFVEIEAEFIERAHRMIWCDMATVGLDGRPQTRVVHPVWEGDTAWMTSLRIGPKANDIDRAVCLTRVRQRSPETGLRRVPRVLGG